ncbi:hypothetical protein ACVWWG_001386 [Bradyrhizobium sp. LB7.2]|jgi:hypothetical protein|uniref:ANTAR domain-containing protein n=1 Tax=Bradyrhizobium sp. LB14.3 TaxID=3156328 RepID=UPI003394C362
MLWGRRNERTSELKQQVSKLEHRLRLRQVVLAAVLQVMHSHALAEPAAFGLIRRTAMERRKTIKEVSAEITVKGVLPRATGQLALKEPFDSESKLAKDSRAATPERTTGKFLRKHY